MSLAGSSTRQPTSGAAASWAVRPSSSVARSCASPSSRALAASLAGSGQAGACCSGRPGSAAAAALPLPSRTASGATASFSGRTSIPVQEAARPRYAAHRQSGRHAAHRALGQSPDSANSFPQSVGKLLRRIQGGLPIVGLLSKLASPTGLGVDEISYAEFCRTIYNKRSDTFNKAVEALEAKQGRPARPRYVLLLLWMALNGAGLVPAKTIMQAARRVRVTFDMEIEIERFEGIRDAKIKEFGVASKPQPKFQDQMDLAVDALCQLLFGVGEGKLPTGEDIKLLRPLLTSTVDGQGVAEAVQQSLLTKPKRLKQD